jgi:hypothetical protein
MLDPSNPQEMDFTRELAATLAEHGYSEDSAELYASIASAHYGGGQPVDLSNPGYSDMLDMALIHRAQAEAGDAGDTRTRKEAAARARALSAEDKLARAYQQIGRGTYSRTGALEFSSPSAAARQLAEHRWGVRQPGTVTGRPACGSVDDLGYCRETAHDVDCGSIASTEIGETLRDSGAYARLASQPWADQHGRTWADQFGRPVTLTGHVEAATGERLGHGVQFETGAGRPDVVSPQRQARFGDPSADPGEDPGGGVPPETAAVAAAYFQQAEGNLPGLFGRDVRRERERFTEHATEAAVNAALSGSGSGRLRHPDYGSESPGERRERIHAQRGAVQPREFGEPPVNGSLGYYEAS